MPCRDESWAFPDHIISVWDFGNFHFSSAFSLYIIFASTELCHIHHFLQQSVDLTDRKQNLECREHAQKIEERLTAWRSRFHSASVQLLNDEHIRGEHAQDDLFLTLTTCLIDWYGFYQLDPRSHTYISH